MIKFFIYGIFYKAIQLFVFYWLYVNTNINEIASGMLFFSVFILFLLFSLIGLPFILWMRVFSQNLFLSLFLIVIVEDVLYWSFVGEELISTHLFEMDQMCTSYVHSIMFSLVALAGIYFADKQVREESLRLRNEETE